MKGRASIRLLASWLCLGLLGTSQVWAQASSFTLTLREDEFETLGDLKPAYIDFTYKAVPNVSLDEIVRRYVALIKSATDPELRVKALHRLANLEPLLSESSQALIDDELWRVAIQIYEDALASRPGRPDADELRYQLARAHEMRGNLAASLEQLKRLVASHPRSRHYLEAQFRVAELQYGFGHYDEAERAYSVLLRPGVQSPYASKAQYMLGWALYKQDKLDQALDQYLKVLDSFYGTRGELDRIEQDLVDDTLRIMSVIFSFRQGAETLAELLARHDRHRYASLLYDRLVAHYMERERYQDAAATSAEFLRQYPKAPEAPRFAIRRIEAYQAGGFESQVWPEKERFVASFGIYGEFWRASTPEARATWEGELRQYLRELGRRYYVTAQNAKDNEEKQWYRGAASHLRHYVEAFPADEASGEHYFLLGEALFKVGDYPAAADAYGHAAYDYLGFAKRAEAAYAAILAYDRQIGILPEQERRDWRQRRLENLIRFADSFPEDSRTARLTVLAANEKLDFGEYSDALALARRVTETKQKVERDIRRGAWLAEAESAFALHLYAEAEHGFSQALTLWPAQDGRSAEVREKLAASVYKQAELALAQSREEDAIGHFLRVGKVVPESPLRINGHYDAAMKLLELEQWGRAIAVMEDFAKQYPKHELAQGIPDKLIYAYEKNDQPAEAARVLLQIAEKDGDPERRRKALFQGAELLEKAGRIQAALEAYARYASRYPRPLDTVQEVHRKLADIHGMRQEIEQRNRWLNALIKLDREAGKDRTERSRYLAAGATWQLAQDEKARFDAIRLTLPLKASLARKRKAMEQVMSWLKRTNDYGIGEFATAATHLSGEVYRQLGRDLIESDRPSKLNELELEQYNLLLEEQAFPFEEKAIEFFELNAKRARDGIYDKWVQESYRSLSTMIPARYNKKEMRIHVVSQFR